ncbi:MAG: hypothetical protein IPK83_08875 [Planctomycetes bacterium]|nr:hypothetical protein [Planctomycetota bacterium]
MTRFVVQLTGERADQQPVAFTVDVLLENENGPTETITIVPDADGAFDVTVEFEVDPNFPVAEGEGIPPSVYDGQFLLFARPSVGVDFDTVQVRISGQMTTTVTEHPIRLTYFDGFPSPFSDAPGCDALNPRAINPLAIEDFRPVCPPQNRTQGSGGFGNFDGHRCDSQQITNALIGGSGIANDGLTGEFYDTGLVFVEGSDGLVMTIGDGVDTNGDGIPETGPFGFHLGDGYRVALQRFFGQPPYVAQGGLGIKGARFRGAWYQPQGVYDPFSRFGHSIDVMPDMDTFGLGSTVSEVLISAPDGGTLANLPLLDMTADLQGLYDHNGANPNSRTFASSAFNYGVDFTNVVSATVFITGTARNVPVFRVGIDDGSGRPLSNVGSLNRSRDILLWGGAGAPAEEDTPPTIEYDELYGDVVNFAISAELPRAALPLMRPGIGAIALEILDDCSISPSSVQIDTATLNVVALTKTGYLVMLNGDDYTCSECTALENNRCTFVEEGDRVAPDADTESAETRPMSWPSYGCHEPSQSRVPCYHSELANILGERSLDGFGFGYHAGDLNLDGVNDFAVGAPGSDNNPFTPDLFCGNEANPLTNNGKTYVIYGTPTLGSGRPCDLPERFEIRGTHNDDQFGRVQGNAGDMDGDSNPDVFVGR